MTGRGQQRQQGNGFELGDYNDVASRIAEFRDKHPEGSLQPVDPAKPYRIEQIGGDTFIVAVAAAYRTPDDPRPGVGMAQEAYPGKTPYTRGSELQNAETSAWGRAIVAAMAADTRRGVASAEEVRNRRAEQAGPQRQTNGHGPDLMAKAFKAISDAPDPEALEKIGRYISTLVDSGELVQNDAVQLRQALVARLDVVTLASEAQLTRLHTLFAKANIPDREDKLAFCSAVLAREIASTGELTKAEYAQVVAAVEEALAEPVAAEVPS